MDTLVLFQILEGLLSVIPIQCDVAFDLFYRDFIVLSYFSCNQFIQFLSWGDVEFYQCFYAPIEMICREHSSSLSDSSHWQHGLSKPKSLNRETEVMVKTYHGMQVVAAAEAEFELRGGLVLTCISAGCEWARPCCLASCRVLELAIPQVLCLRPVSGQNCLGILGLFTLPRPSTYSSPIGWLLYFNKCVNLIG